MESIRESTKAFVGNTKAAILTDGGLLRFRNLT